MGTNTVEKVDFKNQTIITNVNSSLESKPVQKQQEKVSELLAGVDPDILQKDTVQTKEEHNVLSFAQLILCVGLAVFPWTKRGQKFIIKTLNNSMVKMRNVFYTQRMKNVVRNHADFKEVPFQCSNSPDGVVQMGKKLGIKIFRKNIKNAGDIKQFNTVLSVFADAYNKSKGRIIMPKKLSLEVLKDLDGEASFFGKIRLNRCSSDKMLEYNACHELGHINHYGRTNLAALGTPEQALEFGLDSSKAKEFAENKKVCRDIRKSVSIYAATSPCEFVAETFAFLLGGVQIPKHLLKRYAQYKGMTRLPVIRDFSEVNNIAKNNNTEALIKFLFETGDYVSITDKVPFALC